MRILVLFGLLLFGTTTVACAQQRDTTTRRDTLTRRDSLARPDTISPQADSILRRELERIRGEPRTRIPPGAVGPRDTLALAGQDTTAALGIEVRLELGTVLGHEVLREATFDTETEIGGVVRGGVEYRFRHGLGTFALLGGSVARVTSTGTLGAEARGTATQIDLMAGVSWRLPIRQAEPEPVILHVAGGGAWLSGPDGVPPYTVIDDDDLPFGVWEVGVSVRPGRRAIGATAVFQSVRVLPDEDEEASRAHRLILALRIGS